MSHFALIWKARTIEKYRQNYENEKINSIIMSDAEIPEKTLRLRWRHYSHGVQKRLSRTFSKWYPVGTTVSNFLVNFRPDMRFPNIFLRSFFGFVGGLVLTYLCFVFLVFQLSLSLLHATVMSSLFGVLITLGLTFSNRMRCLVFLLIPQLFSRAGRYTLTCYALVLILTGPATNTLANSEVLTESMACSQEQIKSSVRDINESIQKPYNSVKHSIKLMVEEIKRITIKMRTAMLKINRLVLSVASIIQSSFDWLGSIDKTANSKLGTPYNRCANFLETTYDSCQDGKAPWAWYVAALTSVAKGSCSSLQSYERFFVASDFAEETFFATIKRKLNNFTSRVSSLLHLKITTRHSYNFIGNTSSPGQVTAGIVTEIRNRADPILTWLSWSSCVTSLFLLLIISRAKHYQHMYETRSRFDNRYITKEFRELDLKRLREGRKTVLPLNRRERAKYVTTTSFRLVTSEKVHLNRTAVFMVITTFKLMIHIVADYSLYWVLMTIRDHGRQQTPLQPGPPTTGAHIAGRGILSRLLQSLLNTLNIPLMSAPSSNSCLPNPHTPDFKSYGQIGTLIFLLWFFGLFEPYGLRLRHLIVGHYRPERAKTRAVWLYNHILRNRGSFMKFARRKLHREYKYSSETKFTFQNWLRSLVPFRWLQLIFGLQLKEPSCVLCHTVDESLSTLLRCEVSSCPGTYCSSCFSDIGGMCTICLKPSDYGDLSDVSLEKGSSDDESDVDNNRWDEPKDDNIVNKEISYHDEASEDQSNNCEEKHECEYEESSENGNDIEYDRSTLCLLLCQNSDHSNKIHDETRIQQTNKNNSNPKDEKITMKHKIVTDETRTAESIKADNVLNGAEPCVSKSNLDVKSYNWWKQFVFVADTIDKRNSYTIYSFYRIEVHDMSLLVTKMKYATSSKIAENLRKKIVRKKITIVSNTNLCTRTYSNGQQKENHKVNRTKQNKEKSESKKKGENNKKQNNSNELNELQNNKPKESKQRKNKATATSIKRISNIHVESFHSACNKYWKSISNAFSCTDVPDKKSALPVEEENKHKRKKRHKTRTSKKYLKTKDIEDSRQFRISSFFADQDWKKLVRPKVSAEVHKSEIFIENEIEVNNIKIPRLNLRFSTDSLNNIDELNDIKNCHPESEHFCGKKKNFASAALERFFRAISLMSVITSMSLPQTVTKDKQADERMICIPDPIGLPRSMKYFKSLGNDYGETDAHIGKKHASDTNKTEVAIAVLKTKTSPNCSKIPKGVEVIIPIKKKKLKDTITYKEIQPDQSIKELTNALKDMKRDSTESFVRVGIRAPIQMIKEICTTIFTKSTSHIKMIPEKDTVKTEDKAADACPCTKSACCQKPTCLQNTADRCLQVQQNHFTSCKKSQTTPILFVANESDNGVKPVCLTCTCATQYHAKHTNQINLGTWKSEGVQVNSVRSTCTCATQYYCDQKDKSESSESFLTNNIDEDTDSVSSINTDRTNDTAVCSLAVHYNNTDVCDKDKKPRVKIVTKKNQSTLTDDAKLCDVSTVTQDWWSPLVDNKYTKNINKETISDRKETRHETVKCAEIALERKEGDIVMLRRNGRRVYRNKGISTDGRIVTFRSRAQIIPRTSFLKSEDILSPSRYLLESQKYYNELFSPKIYSPHVFPVSLVNPRSDTLRSPRNSRHQNRLCNRMKRLESWTPRKQMPSKQKCGVTIKRSDLTRVVRNK